MLASDSLRGTPAFVARYFREEEEGIVLDELQGAFHYFLLYY